MRYKVTWSEVSEFYTYIEADSKEEAINKLFQEGPGSAPEPTGFCEMQGDIEAEEADGSMRDF